ncbi:hypothetical protein C8R43DRAFT_1111262 [Mycena crocata]|nr:hypothetical protein C8R43DRAFT_1111262 [Mycena crocata]
MQRQSPSSIRQIFRRRDLRTCVLRQAQLMLHVTRTKRAESYWIEQMRETWIADWCEALWDRRLSRLARPGPKRLHEAARNIPKKRGQKDTATAQPDWHNLFWTTSRPHLQSIVAPLASSPGAAVSANIQWLMEPDSDLREKNATRSPLVSVSHDLPCATPTRWRMVRIRSSFALRPTSVHNRLTRNSLVRFRPESCASSNVVFCHSCLKVKQHLTSSVSSRDLKRISRRKN